MSGQSRRIAAERFKASVVSRYTELINKVGTLILTEDLNEEELDGLRIIHESLRAMRTRRELK